MLRCRSTHASMPKQKLLAITAPAEAAGKRLDQFLVSHLPNISRARIQQLISEKKILINDLKSKPSVRLRGGERITILGEPQPRPLRAIAEEIPLEIIYEDDDLAVINKPAGMMAHAGSGATDDARNRGTLVNALLHHFGKLSAIGGELRPGIVHRLDKATSGLILVAKNDESHRKLAAQFATRLVKKTYIALVHGWIKQDRGMISSSISRDRIRRTRMTTRRPGGREAITHYAVQRRIDSRRTHQIRVHLASLGHPVVGDTLYGAPRELRARNGEAAALSRNFLHAVALQFHHPRTGTALSLSSPLPEELSQFLSRVQ